MPECDQSDNNRRIALTAGGTIWQDLPTEPGRQYRIRLAYNGRDETSFAPLIVRFGENELPQEVFRLPSVASSWFWIDYRVAATQATTRLYLQGPGPAVALDAISVVLDDAPPSIVTPPVSQSTFLESSVVFHADISGSQPMWTQWYQDGLPVEGSFNPTLWIHTVNETHAGTYMIVATNAYGGVTSAPVSLTIDQALSPTILLQPYGDSVVTGQYFSLSVLAVGSPPLTYQWFQNGTAIANATNRHLEFTSIQLTNTGSYTVRVRNGSESVTSLPALIQLVQNPTEGGAVIRFDVRPIFAFDPVITVYDVDGVTPLAGPAYAAQLYAGPTAETLRPVGLPRPFSSGFNHGWWSAETLVLPHIAVGQDFFVQVKAWDRERGATYEEARAVGGRFGRSVVRPKVGATDLLDPNVRLTDLESFSLTAGLQEFQAGILRLLDRESQRTFLLELTGSPGFRYLIERRSDDVNWEPFMILTNETGTVQFRDQFEPGTQKLTIYRSRILD